MELAKIPLPGRKFISPPIEVGEFFPAALLKIMPIIAMNYSINSGFINMNKSLTASHKPKYNHDGRITKECRKIDILRHFSCKYEFSVNGPENQNQSGFAGGFPSGGAPIPSGFSGGSPSGFAGGSPSGRSGLSPSDGGCI